VRGQNPCPSLFGVKAARFSECRDDIVTLYGVAILVPFMLVHWVTGKIEGIQVMVVRLYSFSVYVLCLNVLPFCLTNEIGIKNSK
jgi:hypothetical protein